MSAAVALFDLLNAAEDEGIKIPHGTKSVTVDAKLCAVLARRTLIESDDLYRAFYGVPVRAAWNILRWTQREAPGDLTEQTETILNWSRKYYGMIEGRVMQERGVA